MTAEETDGFGAFDFHPAAHGVEGAEEVDHGGRVDAIHGDVAVGRRGQSRPGSGFDAVAQYFERGRIEFFHAFNDELAIGHQLHARTHGIEEDDVGAGDTRMQDVAADRHQKAFDMALVAADGQRVEQRLRRMLVPPVARVQHGAIHLLGQQVDRAACTVADHQQVRVHRVQRHRGVDQRLALLHR